nr:uncharacterized protein LOC127313973 isoform X2 [Lolium perenne]
MPPRRSLAGGGGKLKKPLTGKLRAAAEERLTQLRAKFRLHPPAAPPASLAAHEAALRSVGLLDFARLDLQSEPARPDLVSQLVAYYDPAQHRSFVWDTRLAVSRTDFARALSLPPRPAPAASPPDDVDPAALVSAVLEFMRVYVLPAFTGADMCVLPPEVAAAEQAVKDESAHRVDWAGLIWGLVEKEILELPKRDDGVCYFGPYLQRLILAQKPDLLKPLEDEEKREAALEVVSLEDDDDDGDVAKSPDDLEPRDANADVTSNPVEEASEMDVAPVRSNILDESEPGDADGDTKSKILEEPEIKGASSRINDLEALKPGDADAEMSSKEILEESKIERAHNNLDELEAGDAAADTSSKEILEESKIESAHNNLDELEAGDADADMTSKEILEESKINLDELEAGDVDDDLRSKTLGETEADGAHLRSSNLDEQLESGDADAETRTKNILEESEIEGAQPLKSNNLDELDSGDVDVDTRSKTLEESETEGARLMSSNVDELESEDVDLRSKNMDDLESGDVDANARSKISEASMVVDDDANDMNLDEPNVGDELGLDFVAPEPLAVIHEARTSNDEVPGKKLCEGDEGVSVSPAQEDGSPEMVSMTQEEVLAVAEEDVEEECEEERGTAGWISSANDDDSMDAEENAFVQNLDESDNEEGEESEQDGFEGYRGGMEMGWRMEDENGGEGATNSFPGMQFENLNKGNGMRDVMSFDDGFSEKLGSLHGMGSTNLLQAMNSIPTEYNGTENVHDLPSGEFLAMGADAHKNGVDLGTGSSFLFGNNGKRHIGDIDGYNDQMEAQQQFLQGNQQKRARNCNNSVSSGSAFFNANISDPIHTLLLKASISYEQKDRDIQEALSQKQYMANLLQEKDTIIQTLNAARFEQENKYQAKLRYFEHDLNVMGQLVSGYKKALKQSQASFSEYRKKFPSNKFRYHDVPNSGGLVVSVNELERKRQEEEQQKLAAANEMIENFQHQWFSKAEDWTNQIVSLGSNIEELAREIDLLKEKREAKFATVATEELVL